MKTYGSGFLEYHASKDVFVQGVPYGANKFYSLLFALIRCADSDNLEPLRSAFPDQVRELQDRYNAQAGALSNKELKIALRLFK